MAQVLVVDRTPSVQDALAFVLELDGLPIFVARHEVAIAEPCFAGLAAVGDE